MECPYCYKFFTTQGITNHVKSHENRGDKIGHKPRVGGKVKTLGPRYEPGTEEKTPAGTSNTPVDLSKDCEPTTDVPLLDAEPAAAADLREGEEGGKRVHPQFKQRQLTNGVCHFIVCGVTCMWC